MVFFLQLVWQAYQALGITFTEMQQVPGGKTGSYGHSWPARRARWIDSVTVAPVSFGFRCRCAIKKLRHNNSWSVPAMCISAIATIAALTALAARKSLS